MKLSELAELLSSAGISSPEYDARELFFAFGGFDRGRLLCADDSSEREELLTAAKRRIAREPLQYIVGEVAFYRELYRVTPDCLIPRADTEILVDTAVKRMPSGARFLDLCCGSGCVGISTLKSTEGTRCTFADISEGAIALTLENAERNGVPDRCRTVRADLLSEESVPAVTEDERFDVILSNPPYVKSSVYKTLDSEIFAEPEIAFVGGEDGADFYRTLTPLYLPYLKEGGFIAYEIGYDQREIITEIARENGCCAEIIKDYSGLDRVAVLTKIRNG